MTWNSFLDITTKTKSIKKKLVNGVSLENELEFLPSLKLSICEDTAK